MSTPRSRRASVPQDDEALRLPRPPGAIRRFWARHPIVADVLIALVCLVLSLATSTSSERARIPEDSGFAASVPLPMPAAVVLMVLTVATCALLLRRRQWPVVAFIAAYGLALVQLFLTPFSGGPLLLVASYSLAVYRSTRAAWTGFGIGMSALTVAALMGLLGGMSLQVALNALLGDLALGLIGTLIGANVGGRKRYLEAVIDRSRQLLVERDQHAQLAAAAERDRIAREMHDIVSHTLTVVVALSEGAAATEDRERARDAANAAAATARSALTEMRATLGVLRDGDGEAPLTPAQPIDPHDTVAAAQQAGYPVTLSVTGEPDVPPSLGYAVGRIVQEGVTNAMRHAPAATAISVRIGYAADAVVIEIDNDGVTGPTGTTGFGLRGLTERAAHVNGSVHSGPTGRGRWRLRAELPLQRTENTR